MKKLVSKLIAYVMTLTAILSFSLLANAEIVEYEDSAIVNGDADTEGVVDIIFTHDLHSFLEAYDVIEDGVSHNVGGMERLYTLIDDQRAKNPDTLLLDGGDYPMGTLYQTLFESEAIEYQLLSMLGFDAVTFGNHDFDYGPEAMVGHFKAAKEKSDYYPQFVICNIDWNYDNTATKDLYAAMKDMNLCDYYVVEKNGLKIGITGVLGYDAIKCAPTCELNMLDPIESVKATVAKMKKEENPDMIICLSHSGTLEDLDKSEDVILAKEVPDIDFILSGHSHTLLSDVVKQGNTYIGSCGCYGRYTGFIQLKKNASGRFDLKTYELISMDEGISRNEDIIEKLDGYKSVIDENYLNKYEYNATDVVATNDVDFSSVDDVYFNHDEQNLGSIMADAYRWAAGLMDGEDFNTVDVGIAPAGTIRGTYYKGDVTVTDVYNSFSLGQGADGTVGYPLISVYLTGAELKTLCEVDASVSDLMNAARLYMSGLEFTYNPNRILLNKVTDVRLNSGLMEDTHTELDDKKLYRVVTDMYSGQMLGTVTDLSKGLLSVVPKKADGTELVNLEDAIIHDADGEEVKAWVAIARFMESTDSDRDGIGNIPDYYSITTDRKVVETSKSPIAILSSLNKFAVIIIIVVILLLAIIILLVCLLIRTIAKITRKVKSKNNIDDAKIEDQQE